MKICWNTLDKADWNSLLPSNAAALHQSWHYGASLQAMGRTVHRAVIHDAAGPVALAQILCRQWGRLGKTALLSRAPIWLRPTDQRACLRQLRANLPGRGATLMLATPEQTTRVTLPLMTPCHMAELALTPDLKQMRRKLRVKWRNRLVHAENSGTQITRHTDHKTLNWLIDIDLRQQRAKGYRALPPTFLTKWQQIGRNSIVYVARHKGEITGAMLFLTHAPGATYQIGWSSDAGRARSVHNLILWQTMCDFAKIGHLRLDLGTIDTINTPGLARFKLGTGANLRTLGATGLILPNPFNPIRHSTRYGGKLPAQPLLK